MLSTEQVRWEGPEQVRSTRTEHPARTSARLSGGALLSPTRLRILKLVAGGAGVRQVARLTGKAVSTVAEQVQGLAADGLLQKGPSRCWEPTGTALMFLQDIGEGRSALRTPARVHNLRLRADLEAQIPPEFREQDNPSGFVVTSMRGWRQVAMRFRLLEFDVHVRLRARSVVAYLPALIGSPAATAVRALALGADVRRHLASLKIRVSPFTFEGAPEYAYPNHPAIPLWLRAGWLIGPRPSHTIWVDFSKGYPELEVNRISLALAIEAVALEAHDTLETWLHRVRAAAQENEMLDADRGQQALAIPIARRTDEPVTFYDLAHQSD